MRPIRLAFIIASLICVVFFAFFLLVNNEKREVKNLIITYNNLLQKANFELNSNLMRNLTTEQNFKKIDNYIAYLYKTRRVIKGEVKDIEFEDVKVKKDFSTVLTRERWLYFYADPATKQPISEFYEVIYGNTYHLRKIKGRWVLDKLQSREIGGKAEG